MTLYFGTSKIKDRGANSGLFYAGNVIKKGSVVGGHDKHFSIPNKITLDDSGKSSENMCWRIAIKFQLSNVNADQRLFGVVATNCAGVVIGVLNGKLNYWLSSDGVKWDIASRAVGTNTLAANTIYKLHFKRYNVDGVLTYRASLKSSVDNAWVDDIVISNAVPIKSGFYYNLGRDWNTFTENATFYLDSDTYISKWNVRGRETRLWSATSEGVVPVTGAKTAYTGFCYIPVGNVNIVNRTIKKFSDTSYVYTNAIKTLHTASTWDLIVKVRTGSDVSSQQYVIAGSGTTARDFVIFLQNNKLTWQMSSNGTSYDIVNKNSSLTVSPNIVYYFRIQFTGSAYALSYSTNGGRTFTQVDKIESTAKVVANTTHIIGGIPGSTGWYWRGNIYVDDRITWCKVDGQIVWDINTAEVQKVYNLQSYNPSQIIYNLGNPSTTTTSAAIPIYRPGVYKVYLVGGGNTTNWCYIGCNYPGSAAGFIGKMYFNTKCYLRLIIGGQDAYSHLQVASWTAPDTWYNLVSCEAGKDASGGAGRGGYIAVNRDSTFNNYFDIELETNGKDGSNSGYPASVYGGYGTKDVNGLGKLEYIRENQ
jgi:hypothetical protein